METSGNVFENLHAQEKISPSLPSNSKKNLAGSYCEGVQGIATRHGEKD